MASIFNISMLLYCSSLVSGGKIMCNLRSVASQLHQSLHSSHSFITLQLSVSTHLHGFKLWKERPAFFETIFLTSEFFLWLYLQDTTQWSFDDEGTQAFQSLGTPHSCLHAFSQVESVNSCNRQGQFWCHPSLHSIILFKVANQHVFNWFFNTRKTLHNSYEWNTFSALQCIPYLPRLPRGGN